MDQLTLDLITRVAAVERRMAEIDEILGTARPQARPVLPADASQRPPAVTTTGVHESLVEATAQATQPWQQPGWAEKARALLGSA